MPFSPFLATSMTRFENCQSGHTKSPQSRSVWLVSMSTDVDCSKTLRVGLAGGYDRQSIGPNVYVSKSHLEINEIGKGKRNARITECRG